MFRAAAENMSGMRLREIMMDNAQQLAMGGNTRHRDGIKFHTTVLDSPASNRVAERRIGVLTSAVHTMLHDSGLCGQKLSAQRPTCTTER